MSAKKKSGGNKKKSEKIINWKKKTVGTKKHLRVTKFCGKYKRILFKIKKYHDKEQILNEEQILNMFRNKCFKYCPIKYCPIKYCPLEYCRHFEQVRKI